MLKNLLIVIVIIIAGCGFHLRGKFKIPEHFTSLQIVSLSKYDTLYKSLQRTLANNDIKVNVADSKAYTLSIGSYTFKQYELFRDSEGRTNRSRLVLTIPYTLMDSNGVEIRKSNIISARNIDVDPNAILTTNNETDIVRKELLQDATYKLIRQILAAIAK